MARPYKLSESDRLRKRRTRDRIRLQRIREQDGPLPAKRCRCDVPLIQVDSDEERWCVRCGRLEA